MAKNNRSKRYIFVLIVVIILLCIFCFFYFGKRKSNVITATRDPVVDNSSQTETINQSANIENTQPQIIETEDSTPKPPEQIPSKLKLKVPFMSQAPTYVWDELHEDACEEASILMIYHYLQKTSIPSRMDFDNEIKEMVDYEQEHEFNTSITLSQLKSLSESYLKIDNLEVVAVDSYSSIKQYLYNNGPLIVGAAGKELNNPNFKNGGPNYHMLVIIGYDQDGFITNDPGTRKGENYYYTNKVLFEAIHDWDPENITLGGKNILYISK